METTTETTSISLSAMTAGGKSKPDITAMFDDEDFMYLQPPTWNESTLPYLGDLTPKPTWEIVLKVSRTNCLQRTTSVVMQYNETVSFNAIS